MKWQRLAAAICVYAGLTSRIPAAEYRSANFQVTADSAHIAREVAQAAEELRSTLARDWLDQPLETWNSRCSIRVESQKTGGSGWTSYRLLGGNVTRLGIRIQGPPERLLEYILPHEMTHAILVSALGTTLPRWADEGAAMLAESPSERFRQRLLVEQLLANGDLIPLSQILTLNKYPRDHASLKAFYAQSLLLADFLISRGGHARFLTFVKDGQADWDQAIQSHYDFENTNLLESAWSDWIVQTARDRKATVSRKPSANEHAVGD
jgi:hypothetical protein